MPESCHYLPLQLSELLFWNEIPAAGYRGCGTQVKPSHRSAISVSKQLELWLKKNWFRFLALDFSSGWFSDTCCVFILSVTFYGTKAEDLFTVQTNKLVLVFFYTEVSNSWHLSIMPLANYAFWYIQQWADQWLHRIFTADLLSKRPSYWCSFDDRLYLIIPKEKTCFFFFLFLIFNFFFGGGGCATIEAVLCFGRGPLWLWCSNRREIFC